MTCKDCLHSKVCRDWWSEQEENLFSESNIGCRVFDDRSEWVHLPCEVGDIVYYFDGAYHLRNKNNWKVRPIKVTEFSTKIGRSGKLYPLSIIANGTRYPLTSIGKTVFLTREEAEEVLKALRGEQR